MVPSLRQEAAAGASSSSTEPKASVPAKTTSAKGPGLEVKTEVPEVLTQVKQELKERVKPSRARSPSEVPESGARRRIQGKSEPKVQAPVLTLPPPAAPKATASSGAQAQLSATEMIGNAQACFDRSLELSPAFVRFVSLLSPCPGAAALKAFPLGTCWIAAPRSSALAERLRLHRILETRS